MKIKVVSKILEANDRIAKENSKIFQDAGVYVINLMSAPGAGKTSLLEKTIQMLGDELSTGVIEGDIVGSEDAERLNRFGVPVVQINTEGACHLDANMIHEVIREIPLKELDMVFIENVGNLVCPAEFKTGEDEKVMILSVSEGHDKPLKYPLMFQESSLLIINKMDLLPYLDTDVAKIEKDARSLNPDLKILKVSCKSGAGLDSWIQYLKTQIPEASRDNP